MSRPVLITRDPAPAAKLVRELSSRGLDAVSVPVARSIPLEPLPALPPLDRFDWFAFTSAHAVRAFAASLKETGISIPGHVRIAVVGSASALEVQRWICPVDLEAPGRNARSLADALIAEGGGEPRSLLWPCAATPNPAMEERLNEAGWQVLRWTCYETRPVDPALLRTRLETAAPWSVVVFAASSAVRAFHHAWPLDGDSAVVSIGRATARELERCGVRPRRVTLSAGPEPGLLADAVQAALRELEESPFVATDDPSAGAAAPSSKPTSS